MVKECNTPSWYTNQGLCEPVVCRRGKEGGEREKEKKERETGTAKTRAYFAEHHDAGSVGFGGLDFEAAPGVCKVGAAPVHDHGQDPGEIAGRVAFRRFHRLHAAVHKDAFFPGLQTTNSRWKREAPTI